MPQFSEQLVRKLDFNLREVLVGKYLLFDTCVISRLSSLKTVSPTKEIFSFLNEVNCVPGITEQVYVEYLRDHTSIEKFKKAKEFLLKFPKKILETNRVNGFYEKMIIIDKINQQNGYRGKQVSFVDLTLAVFLQHWSENLFLATFNIKDFCHKIFDIICVLPLVCGKELLLLGIIKANAKKFNFEKEKLEKMIK